MLLATRKDYDYPHIDWCCERCGSIYVSSGVPDTDHCVEGHAATWRPEKAQMDAYIDILEDLDVGDGVVVCGDGPAPLMGRVESVGDGKIVTESLDSPRRTIRWTRGVDEDDPSTIEWAKTDDEYGPFFDDVYHVGTVEVQG